MYHISLKGAYLMFRHHQSAFEVFIKILILVKRYAVTLGLGNNTIYCIAIYCIAIILYCNINVLHLLRNESIFAIIDSINE